MSNAVYFDQIKQLVELQKVDDAIYAVRQDKERAPNELNSLEQRFNASETQRNYIVDKLTHLQEQQKRLSLEIDDDAARIKKSKNKRDGLEEKLQKCNAALNEFNAKRAQVSKFIPQPVFMRYEFIRERLEHPVIVAVKEGICSGCHIAVPPQSFIELQRGQQILSCPNCQRLIFWCEHFTVAEAPQCAPKPLTD